MTDPAEVLKGKRILVVDDESEIREAILDELGTSEVDEAATYDDARRKLLSGRYDAAILDIMGVRGMELLEEFSESLPCLVLTAQGADKGLLHATLNVGSRRFLEKSEILELAEHLAAIFTGTEQEEEMPLGSLPGEVDLDALAAETRTAARHSRRRRGRPFRRT